LFPETPLLCWKTGIKTNSFENVETPGPGMPGLCAGSQRPKNADAIHVAV
jgi:hypothetical protein